MDFTRVTRGAKVAAHSDGFKKAQESKPTVYVPRASTGLDFPASP